MTDEEDQRNAELNEQIKACLHKPACKNGHWYCLDCEARFIVMMLPRKARPKIFVESDNDEHQLDPD